MEYRELNNILRKKYRIRINSETLRVIDEEVKQAQKTGGIKRTEAPVLRATLLLKASDFALHGGRSSMTPDDVRQILRACVPILWCAKTTIIDNQSSNSVALFASDTVFMKRAGIHTRRRIARDNPDKLVESILKALPKAAALNIPGRSRALLRKRVKLWNLEAKVLERELPIS
jgi:hypothetical protein